MNPIKFWAAFAVGVAAGAAVALLYAPQSGEKTRRQLRRNLEDAGDYVKDAADTFSDQAERYIKRGKDVVGDVVDSASTAVNAAKKVVQM
ncbi:MAG TPA: YtxH domain-containing protein [Silvibacterium sp.]|nr:YtxH domain-containing protein [Silvibacterium sp.]